MGSITFVVDEKGDNVFINWLCVSNKYNKNEIPINKELIQNWRGCGLGVLLIIIVIKYCAAKNGKGPTLHLQCGMRNESGLEFYMKNGFMPLNNNHNNCPKSLLLSMKDDNLSYVTSNRMIYCKCPINNFNYKPKEQQLSNKGESKQCALTIDEENKDGDAKDVAITALILLNEDNFKF